MIAKVIFCWQNCKIIQFDANNTGNYLNFAVYLIIKHELVLVLLEELAGPLLVQKEAVGALDVLDGYFSSLPSFADQTWDRDQLYRIPELTEFIWVKIQIWAKTPFKLRPRCHTSRTWMFIIMPDFQRMQYTWYPFVNSIVLYNAWLLMGYQGLTRRGAPIIDGWCGALTKIQAFRFGLQKFLDHTYLNATISENLIKSNWFIYQKLRIKIIIFL